MSDLDWSYRPAGPVTRAFMKSDAFVRGLRGPIGGGKSTACVMEILRRARMQAPGPKGKRATKWVVVRNTYDELRTTSIQTWHQWVPKRLGRWWEQGPPRHHIVTDDLDLYVEFRALDREDDVRKMLSLEVTGAWLNEARELPKAILDGLTGRVGRFPPERDGGPTWCGVMMDTNPTDTDHWWYVLAEGDVSTERNRQLHESMREAEAKLREMGVLRPDQPIMEFFGQPSGVSPEAENIKHLRPGYYQFAMAGKDPEWIKVYVRGEYGFVMDGKPVYPEYRDGLHCRPFELVPRLPLHVGIDFGLTPAAVIGQRTLTGQMRWRSELVSEDMGAVRFGELLGRELRGRYGAFEVTTITGDPAGDQRAATDERTVFQIMRAAGVDAQPAHTNDPTLRREAVAVPLSRLIDGEPGLILHPECSVLRKAMGGGYHYKRVAVSGAERYKDVPEKNSFSHVADAGQYQMLGAGEGRAIIRRPEHRGKVYMAETGFDAYR